MAAITGRLSQRLDWLEIDRQNLLVVIFTMLAALVGGLATGILGFLAIPLSMVALFVAVVLLVGRRVFWSYLVFLLLGYLFCNKGFAWVGFYPVFVGEVGLLLGTLSVILIPFSKRLNIANNFWHPILVPLFAWIAWSLLRTIPYLSQYSFNAIRDAMLYGYAAYALLIAVLIPRSYVEWFLRLYSRWLVPGFILVGGPMLFFFSEVSKFPFKWPGATAPLIWAKPGDPNVHLAAMGAWLLMQLDRRYRAYSTPFAWLLWIAWFMEWLMFGAYGRGGMISNLTAMGITFLLWPRGKWYRPVVFALVALWLMLLTGAYSDLRIELGQARELSAEQIVNNFMSILDSGNDEAGGLETTKQWRLSWWSDITDYTFFGPLFMMGKGYGINLAESDGYLVETDGVNDLRSPHNVYMTVLARSGVPGFLLFVTFVISFAVWMLTLVFKYRKTNIGDAKLATWFMVYMIAFLVNSTFDVFLEGPMAAIPYWALIGFALVYFGKPTDAELKLQQEAALAEKAAAELQAANQT